jgi:hypothetical protein
MCRGEIPAKTALTRPCCPSLRASAPGEDGARRGNLITLSLPTTSGTISARCVLQSITFIGIDGTDDENARAAQRVREAVACALDGLVTSTLFSSTCEVVYNGADGCESLESGRLRVDGDDVDCPGWATGGTGAVKAILNRNQDISQLEERERWRE